ncbi:3-sulfinopropanoyl-CoA desulfinase [Coralliovum pocilloporae]|uniref:3-sulfinopropanoyl-CoA desulfinase n=1 Tax=Coralliovum pocilloporae TaxID=3066369 RepID=UPI003307BB12
MFELTPAQCALRDKAQSLAREVFADRAAGIDASEAYPWDNVACLKDAGFMGMTVPAAYGGQGRSYLDAILVVEELARVCGVTARIAVEANMGAIGAIMRYGSEAQKRLAADLVLSGDKPAICITEPDAGSAATDMTTTAEKRGNGYVLNGTKHWITGGGVSRLHLIFARLSDGNVDYGIAGFLAVRGQDQGLIVGRREPAMGLRGIPETEIHCQDLWLPEDRIILPPEGIRHGFAGLMTAYNGQRVGAGTVALGLAQGAFDQALDYSQHREQFGRPICEFQGLQWSLADMKTRIDAARLMLWHAAASAQQDPSGFPDPMLAAQAKLMASEMAIKVTNDALQMHGAMGYSRNLPMERMVRDARMFTIGGGTAEMLRNLIAGRILNRKLPQTRDGYLIQEAAE